MKKPKAPKLKKIICLPESELPPPKEDFRETFQWRIFRIMAEFVDGFQFITDFKKSVAVFGSTRFPPKNPRLLLYQSVSLAYYDIYTQS